MTATRIGTPERLIRSAQDELIQTHGLLEMQAVAKRAKVSVGLAYHHFGSKAGLIAAVVEAFYNRLEDVDAVLVTPTGKVLYTKGLAPPE